jgi:hypothetical protein
MANSEDIGAQNGKSDKNAMRDVVLVWLAVGGRSSLFVE